MFTGNEIAWKTRRWCALYRMSAGPKVFAGLEDEEAERYLAQHADHPEDDAVDELGAEAHPEPRVDEGARLPTSLIR